MAILIDANTKLRFGNSADRTIYLNLIKHFPSDKDFLILETHKIGFVVKNNNYYEESELNNKSFKTLFRERKLDLFKFVQVIVFKIINKILKNIKSLRYLSAYWTYKLIFKNEKFNYIIRFAYYDDGLGALSKFNKKYKIPYSVVLVDPLIEREESQSQERINKMERLLISCSDKYFVPDSVYDFYVKKYHFDNIEKYYFPLGFQIQKKEDVVPGTLNYFGTLQSFRINSRLMSILEDINLDISTYGWNQDIKQLPNNIKKYDPIVGDEFIQKLTSSNYLLAIDNPENMKKLLPSKLIVYVSSCRPIILFGTCDDSAGLEFLKNVGYEAFIFCNIDSFDKNELLNFIEKYKHEDIIINPARHINDFFPEIVAKKMYQKFNF